MGHRNDSDHGHFPLVVFEDKHHVKVSHVKLARKNHLAHGLYQKLITRTTPLMQDCDKFAQQNFD